MSPFGKVAVLGFGTMGAGIAQVVAQSGRQVTVVDTEETRIEAGRARVADFLADGLRRGKLSQEERQGTLDRITGTTQLGDLSKVELVIEAIVEDWDAKAHLWPRAADEVAADTVLVTNTSALSVTDLAALVSGPHRFAGLHFFNPAPLMALVEVVHAVQTASAVATDLVAFCEDIGKAPVETKDRPGFLVNKLLMPYLNDAVQVYDEELATAEDLDTALELGLGYKMGPLRLLDMIGLDVHHHATRSAYDDTRDPQYASPPLLSRMVAAGYLGDKSGKGFRAGGGLDNRDTGTPRTEGQE
jgi:3-hydroxybutyryl-CoA dehydrogenase